MSNCGGGQGPGNGGWGKQGHAPCQTVVEVKALVMVAGVSKGMLHVKSLSKKILTLVAVKLYGGNRMMMIIIIIHN